MDFQSVTLKTGFMEPSVDQTNWTGNIKILLENVQMNPGLWSRPSTETRPRTSLDRSTGQTETPNRVTSRMWTEFFKKQTKKTSIWPTFNIQDVGHIYPMKSW